MIPQNIAESSLNINNFKSFIKQLYQKHQTQNIKKKKDQNNYFRAEISKQKQQLLTLQVKNKIDF